jgi:metal-dependent amidase/aminoacylase/carboxypeptidase family protein
MRNNLTLARRFGDHLAASGRTAEEATDQVGAGSTDMGDVSQAVPSIHPYLAICDVGESLCHEHRFAECAGSERGFATALDGARALAKTALELLADAELRGAVRAEFDAAR